ncbi:hypothetical protein DFP72DRAFT_640582 [Ephemerocybe angulata]|uniref:F-box domain-containing protein n=1 Tax=Ephemerocybe angulata TaxID=980116 RepID=A0A8H6LW05_9AGAR|nr:hypothetical protein DFP72DRAFT_640582 [Tulosesus angulatus]
MAYPFSDLSRLLDSNILPNSFEAQCVQHIVSKLCGQISELQSQLERLQQQMQRHTAILSPIRRVPPEILGRIFAFASPGRLDDVGRSDLLNLSLVCRGWRDASLLEHQLWSSLRIKPSHLDWAYGDVVAWFRRSGALPKAVDVDAESWDECHAPIVSRGCQLVGAGLVKLLSEGPGIPPSGTELLKSELLHALVGPP